MHGGALLGLPASSVCYLIVEKCYRENRSDGGSYSLTARLVYCCSKDRLVVQIAAAWEMLLQAFPLVVMRAVRHLRT